VLLVDFVREGKTQTKRVYVSLSLLLLGVGLATVTDVEASLKGVVIALIGQRFSNVSSNILARALIYSGGGHCASILYIGANISTILKSQLYNIGLT